LQNIEKKRKQSKSKRKRKTIKKAKEKAGVRGKFQFLVPIPKTIGKTEKSNMKMG